MASSEAPNAPAKPSIRGSFDSLRDKHAHGWAFDLNRPDQRLSVEIVCDGKVVASGTADRFRSDLLKAGLGDGHCSFSLPLPPTLFDGQDHPLTARVAGTDIKLGGPHVLNVPRPLNIKGSFDGVRDHQARGWAFDPDRPRERLSVEIMCDGKVVASGRADQFRDDLLKAGYGDGCCSFSLFISPKLFDGRRHKLTARVAGADKNLGGGPHEFHVPRPLALKGHFDGVNNGHAVGWAFDPGRPGERLSVEIFRDRQVVASGTADRFRADLVKAGMGDGHCSFRLPLPPDLFDGREHTLAARLAGTETNLAGSPCKFSGSAATGQGTGRPVKAVPVPKEQPPKEQPPKAQPTESVPPPAPASKHPSPSVAPTSVVLFWKQNDTTIYGRRPDMVAGYLASRKDIDRVLVLDAPVSKESLLRRMNGKGVTEHGLVYERTCRKMIHALDTGKIAHRVFFHEGKQGASYLDRYMTFLRGVFEDLGIQPRRSVFWMYPRLEHAGDIIESLQPACVVADVVDDHRAWPGVPEDQKKQLTDHYRDVLSRAHFALCNCPTVREAMKELKPDMRLVPNGCDMAPPADPVSDPLHRRLSRKERPVIGFVGNLEKKIDIPLLDRVATTFSNADILLVGSTHANPDILALDKHPNVHFTGVVPYNQAGTWIRLFDVALIPHLVMEQTRYMHPLKQYAYMAWNIPVVSTSVPNIDTGSGMVFTAGDHDAFVQAIRNVLDKKVKLADISAWCAANSWAARLDAQVEEMLAFAAKNHRFVVDSMPGLAPSKSPAHLEQLEQQRALTLEYFEELSKADSALFQAEMQIEALTREKARLEEQLSQLQAKPGK